jgi:hypothetical protein
MFKRVSLWLYPAADAKLERKKRAEREPKQRFNRETDQLNMPITFYQKPS